MDRGGKREGAGRKLGSRNSLTKQLLKNVISEKDKEAILNKAILKAKDGDKDLIKFFLEQFYGKAPQQLDHKIDGLDEILVKRRSNKKAEYPF